MDFTILAFLEFYLSSEYFRSSTLTNIAERAELSGEDIKGKTFVDDYMSNIYELSNKFIL